MRIAFFANKKNFQEFKDFDSMESFLSTIGGRYADSLLLLVNNCKLSQLPIMLIFKFKTSFDIRYDRVA
jgi:hypothetical protein